MAVTVVGVTGDNAGILSRWRHRIALQAI